MEKLNGVKSKGNQAQNSKSSLPVESPRMCLTFPLMNYDKYEVLSSREAHQRLSAQGFLGADIQVAIA